ncbi:MAG: hypothetical protein QXL82_00220 [Candidatus Aenigmatarchaeota archaeon]
MRKIAYDKPIDINEIGKSTAIKILNDIPGPVYVEEKVDGELHDTITACIEKNKYLLICFFGEKMLTKDVHILTYKIPAKRLVFDIAIFSENLDNPYYLKPEKAALLTFLTGQKFVPIDKKFNSGKEVSIEILEVLLYMNSNFETFINPKLFEKNKETFNKLFNEAYNNREGIVIKVYEKPEKPIFIKYVRDEFEEAKRIFPREKYPYPYFYSENIITPYDYEKFVKYWKNIFKTLGIYEEATKIAEKLGGMKKIYEQYLENYNLEEVEEIFSNLNPEIKNLLDKILNKIFNKIEKL